MLLGLSVLTVMSVDSLGSSLEQHHGQRQPRQPQVSPAGLTLHTLQLYSHSAALTSVHEEHLSKGRIF